MGRSEVSDALLAQLKTVNGFDDGSSGRAESHSESCLNEGIDRAVIVYNDHFEQRPAAIGRLMEVDWYFKVEMWIRHNNDIVQARLDSNTYLFNIMDKIQSDHTLGGVCINAIVADGMVVHDNLVTGGKAFLLEALSIKATEYLP